MWRKKRSAKMILYLIKLWFGFFEFFKDFFSQKFSSQKIQIRLNFWTQRTIFLRFLWKINMVPFSQNMVNIIFFWIFHYIQNQILQLLVIDFFFKWRYFLHALLIIFKMKNLPQKFKTVCYILYLFCSFVEVFCIKKLLIKIYS